MGLQREMWLLLETGLKRSGEVRSTHGRSRTGDLALRRRSLYPLSYVGVVTSAEAHVLYRRAGLLASACAAPSLQPERGGSLEVFLPWPPALQHLALREIASAFQLVLAGRFGREPHRHGGVLVRAPREGFVLIGLTRARRRMGAPVHVHLVERTLAHGVERAADRRCRAAQAGSGLDVRRQVAFPSEWQPLRTSPPQVPGGGPHRESGGSGSRGSPRRRASRSARSRDRDGHNA